MKTRLCILGFAIVFTVIEVPESIGSEKVKHDDSKLTEKSPSDLRSAFADQIQPLLKSHCEKCHGGNEGIEGDVNLKNLDVDVLADAPELISTLIEVLDLEEMPPQDESQLTKDQRKGIVVYLRGMLHDAVSKKNRFPHTPIRRMNRFQYNNAVIDLFDLKCTVFTLPERMMREHKGYFKPETGRMADTVFVGSRPLGKSQMIEPRLAGVAAFPQDLRAEHGFDNRGDHLSLSPLLMEVFLKLGHSITQSPDFGPRNVGIWKKFFDAPRDSNNVMAEVRGRLTPFLTLAFRQPAKPEVVDRYATYVERRLDSGADFTDAMLSVAAATIASPKFLYLYDKSGQSDSAERVDGFELASRLSFFLWGSIPDAQLLELAESQSLDNPEVLNEQIERMLNDRKVKRFCDSFPSQWLQLERIISSVPNRNKFPQFYFSQYRKSMHMMIEPLLLFETVLIENQSITQFIDSDFTYRSVMLDAAYGELSSKEKIGNGRGGGATVLHFQRVPVTDRRSGGLITNAAVMTMTSGPERTQPITRGAWIAGVIFNNPPEPPPADVPALEEKPLAGQENLTLRERLAAHRERSDCKGCHEQIDPLGFALENYDAIGAWRTRYVNGRNVDMSGTLFRKHSFDSVIEFKDAILAEKDRFTKGLAGHLLSFALAREIAAADQIAIDSIAEATAIDDYRFKTLIKQVVLSDPFLNKSNPPTE